MQYKNKFKGYKTGGKIKDKSDKTLFYVNSINDKLDRIKAGNT